ncbi:DnaJ domain-containing protein [Treponema sp. Marseille-Q4523]|uniref:DnaJ domain-containing protein n=1 Tax=Treponema sp. Marseille-Q4523 TaxID=2810610 RepID=UPI001961E73F|nr:DnaJ domain-containing protein [Treponema sp. Marseille-Q4523]
MTDSMYDKLGDLLKAALEKGDIPKSGEKKAETNVGTDERSYAFKTRSKAGEADMFRASNGSAQTKNKTEARRKTMRGGQRGGTKVKLENILRTKDKKNIGEVFKSGNGAERARPFEVLPDRIKKACETLGVKAGADESEIRSAYRKKLKRFHPDSNAENETVQRVAHKKTEEIVEAYKAILAYKDSIR